MANEISNSGQFQTTGYQNTAIPQSAHDSSSVVSNTLIPGSQGSGYEALPRIIKVDSSTGCTLTKAHIKGLTPGEFEALGNKETDLARVIASSAEAKLLGVEERGLTALLTSSVQNIKPLINKQNIAEQSIILPYIQRRQRSVLNANYFAVESGEASSADTAVHPYASGYSNQQGDYEVALNMGGSDWSSPIESLERYFLPGGTVIVNHWASDGSSKEVQFTIVGSRNANAGGIEKAKVMLRPTGGGINPVGHSDGVVPAGIASDYQPTAGILQTIANNVNDYEAWCKNQPTDLSVRLLVNWLQTTRESREVNDTYKKLILILARWFINHLRSRTSLQLKFLRINGIVPYGTTKLLARFRSQKLTCSCQVLAILKTLIAPWNTRLMHLVLSLFLMKVVVLRIMAVTPLT
jgi:hypothetical protein